jgi:hypothetical protein
MVFTTLSLLAMLTATSVKAQSNLHLEVNIPFEFSVGTKVLPAGEYTVRYMAQGTLVIQSGDRHVSQVFNILSTQAGTGRDESSLVFTRYGDQYFLSKIWTAGDNIGHMLRKPHTEKQLIRAKRLFANSASELKTVSVVAHR